MKPPDGIDLLLARLLWPSVIARERATTETARLLVSIEHGKEVQVRLLAWIAQQTLETRVAVGLLVFVRACALDDQYKSPDDSTLGVAVRSPSLLSIFLSRELRRGGEDSPWQVDESDMVGTDALHSGEAPAGYQPPPTFALPQHERFLASRYFARGRHIETQAQLPFMRQWAFEWERLAVFVGLDTTRNERHFWYGNQISEMVAVDTLLSDVYRSAYLRALAWCAGTRQMPMSVILSLAAATCPLNLALCEVEPQARPLWWPTANRSNLMIDTVPAQIWKQVEHLWRRQAVDDDADGKWIVAYAEGLTYDGGAEDEAVAYRLEIGGLFQRLNGPDAPDEDAVSTWYFGRDAILAPWGDSPLRFEGVLGVGAPDAAEFQRALGHFGDASFMPAADLAAPTAWPRWQYWRAPQGIAMPSRLLSTDVPISCRTTREGFEFVVNDEVIGVWRDWAQAVRERGDPAFSSICGNVLLLRREVIERFEAESKSTYTWIGRITGRLRNERIGQRQDPTTKTRLIGGMVITRELFQQD